METSCTIRVRSYECDSYGHVNNAVYLNYLEVARHEYLRDNGISLAGLRASGFALVVARVAIEYRLPATVDDALEISTRPRRKGRVGGILLQRIARDGQEVAEAEVTWVCVDSQGHPARLPPEFDSESLLP